MVILFLPGLCFSQSFDWKKVDEWCPSSFPDFLEGIAYSHLVMGKEITDFIEDNKSSHSSAFVSGVLEYLDAMGFQKAQWGAYPVNNSSYASLCWWVNIYPSYGVTDSYFTNVKLVFKSCNDKEWEYSLGDIYRYNTDYTSFKNRTYNAFRKAYGYKKRDYNVDERCTLKSWLGTFDGERITESSLRKYYDVNGTYGIEGIYESIEEKSLHPRYKIGILESDKGYIIIYLDGANNNYDWIEGEWKASFEKTATAGFWKISSWVMANKNISDKYFASYQDGGLNVIMGDEKTFYLKLYPTSNSIKRDTPSSSAIGSGTGFAISEQGYIATNYHVIENANNIYVKGINGDLSQSYPAKIVISDKINDLAILKIEKSLGGIPYGMKEDKTDVTEEVFAYGYPLTSLLGKEIKFTDGRISSSTGMENDPRYYQHTASLQPGNSGGPLFNKNGNIVGINTLTISKSFDDDRGIDTENIFYSIKTSYLTILMNNLGIAKPSNRGIYRSDITSQYKVIKNYVYTIEVY